MNNIFGINFYIFCISLLIITLYFTKSIRDTEYFTSPGVFDQLASTEAFGMSPGTIDQLASTRVVSEKEQELDNKIYNNLTLQGIINMTESGYKGSDYAIA
jgi:hypothetical protein